VWREPLFGEAKQWHGLGRFRLRGLEKVNSESLLIAAGQNLKRLWRRWGGRRRPGAHGAGMSAPHPAVLARFPGDGPAEGERPIAEPTRQPGAPGFFNTLGPFRDYDLPLAIRRKRRLKGPPFSRTGTSAE
jgi:hypothetical protein